MILSPPPNRQQVITLISDMLVHFAYAITQSNGSRTNAGNKLGEIVMTECYFFNCTKHYALIAP